MYVPSHFAETREDVLHGFIDANPFALLVTNTDTGIEANHLPLLTASLHGQQLLLGHIARANTIWQRIVDPMVLAIFSGSQRYISPSVFPSKHETGKMVPTWNYVAAHVKGRISFVHERADLLAHVHELTTKMESGRATPWHVADAPADFIDTLLGHIVGIRIEVVAIQGKWKLSQNRSTPDREGLMRALTEDPSQAAADMVHAIQCLQSRTQV
jgi:transcriptional regulator